MNLKEIKALKVGDHVAVARRDGPSGTLQTIGLEVGSVLVLAVGHKTKISPPKIFLANRMEFSRVDGANLANDSAYFKQVANPRLFLVTVEHAAVIEEESKKRIAEQNFWWAISTAVTDRDLDKLRKLVKKPRKKGEIT